MARVDRSADPGVAWTPALPARGPAIPGRRRWAAAALAAVLLAGLTAGLATGGSGLDLPNQILLYLLVVVAVALVGGAYPALPTAVVASQLINWYFVPPLHTFVVAARNDAVALAGFVVVAAAVSAAVELAARRSAQARRSAAESATLATLASRVLSDEAALPALVDAARSTFGLDAVALLAAEPADPGDPGAGDGPTAPAVTRWRRVAGAGASPPQRPADADVTVPAGDGLLLALRGHAPPPEDAHLLAVLATHAAVAHRQRELAAAAAAAAPIAEADRLRTALLRAVGHELRGPLAAAKAAVSSLRSTEVAWSEQQRRDWLAAADDGLDKLAALVENLLDMSRLQAGVLSVFPEPVALDEAVATALAAAGPAAGAVEVDVPADLPAARADPVLLERVLVNLVGNALRHAGGAPTVRASVDGDRVELRVVDRGRGVDAAARAALFAPFQRRGDAGTGGVGLGLAVSRGLTEAMSGRLRAEDTPGGGLTMVLALPRAAAEAPPGARERPAAPPRPEPRDRPATSVPTPPG